MLSVYYAWRTDILAFLGDSLDFVGEPISERGARVTPSRVTRDCFRSRYGTPESTSQRLFAAALSRLSSSYLARLLFILLLKEKGASRKKKSIFMQADRSRTINFELRNLEPL